MNRDTAEFVIYIINTLAVLKGAYPSAVYRALSASGCIRSYLVPLYDVLHTMSSVAVADDCLKYMAVRGFSI